MKEHPRDPLEFTELEPVEDSLAFDQLEPVEPPELEELEPAVEVPEIEPLPEVALSEPEAPTSRKAEPEPELPPELPAPEPLEELPAPQPRVELAAPEPLVELPEPEPALVELPGAEASKPEPLAARPAAAAAEALGATAAAAPGGPAAPGVKGLKRELEKAPQLLRKASRILLAGSLLPWLVGFKTAGAMPWTPWAITKIVALVAVWIFQQGYVATHGGEAKGVIGKLATAHRMAAPILAAVVAAAALLVALTTPGMDRFAASGEVLTVLLAGATFSHIFGYEHGGKFNPIFPLMFLGPGIAGLLGIFGAVSALGGEDPLPVWLGLVGTVIVAAGGMMAMYVMYVAMKQAKVEGDRKKAEAREKRQAVRRTGRR